MTSTKCDGGARARTSRHLQLPVHAPVVEMHGEVITDEAVEHDNVVAAASQQYARHAVLKQIVRDDCATQLVVEVHRLH